jgi:hypothetical protein
MAISLYDEVWEIDYGYYVECVENSESGLPLESRGTTLRPCLLVNVPHG